MKFSLTLLTSLVAASSFIFGAGLTAIAQTTSSQNQTNAASDLQVPTSVAPSEFVPEGAQDLPAQPQFTPSAETNRADSLSQDLGNVDQRTTAPTRDNTVSDPNRTDLQNSDLQNNVPSTSQATPRSNTQDPTAPTQNRIDSTPTDRTGPDGVNNRLDNSLPSGNQMPSGNQTSPNRNLNSPRQGADAAPNAAPGGSTQYPTPPGRIPAPIDNVDGNRVTPQQQNRVPGSVDGTMAPRQEPSDIQQQPGSVQPQVPGDRNSSSGMSGFGAVSMNRNLDETLRSSSSFELFNALLRVADQNGAISAQLAGDNYTIFAPTDEVLASLPPGAFKQLVQPENRALLQQIISNHIVRGNVPVSYRSGIAAVQPSIQASNGVIYPVNGILVPNGGSLSLSNPY